MRPIGTLDNYKKVESKMIDAFVLTALLVSLFLAFGLVAAVGEWVEMKFNRKRFWTDDKWTL